MQVSVGEARDQFSQLLKAVEDGETVVITRHGKPVAELAPAARRAKPRFGTLEGKIKILDPDWDRPQNDVEAWLRGDV